MKLEPVEIHNAKTSTFFFCFFLKEDKYLEKEKFMVNLPDLKSKLIFLELKAFFPNRFSTRLISKYF